MEVLFPADKKIFQQMSRGWGAGHAGVGWRTGPPARWPYIARHRVGTRLDWSKPLTCR